MTIRLTNRISTFRLVVRSPITYMMVIAAIIVIVGISGRNISLTGIGAVISIALLIVDKASTGRRARESFLSDYLKHSKDIGSKIHEGWRHESVFDTCELKDGHLVRKTGKEPQLEDIGLANLHLEKGYPDVWKLKNEAQEGCVNLCNQMKQNVESFIHYALKVLDEEFQSDGRRLSLSKKNDGYSPNSTSINCYLESIVSVIFDYVTTILNLESRRPNPTLTEVTYTFTNQSGNQEGIRIMELRTPTRGLGYGNESAMKELKLRFERLVNDDVIRDFVRQYYLLSNELGSHKKKKEFFDGIDNLWKGIYENGQLMKGEGACIKCPRRPILGYF